MPSSHVEEEARSVAEELAEEFCSKTVHPQTFHNLVDVATPIIADALEKARRDGVHAVANHYRFNMDPSDLFDADPGEDPPKQP